METSLWRLIVARAGQPTRLLLATVALTLGACEGDNLFRNPVGIGPDDGRDPTVKIELPDSGQRVAVGDSVLVQVRVKDTQGVARLEVGGFAVKGSMQLGTRTAVPRFELKVVDLEDRRPVVRDTVVTRYLIATADTVPADSVLLIAQVTDLSGNQVADTARISIGGPKIQITSPLAGAEVRPGAELRVQLTARDSLHRLQTVRLITTGSLAVDSLLTLDFPLASLDTVVVITVPATAPAGDLVLRAVARNTLNDTSVSPAVTLKVLAPSQDTRAPVVHFRVAAPLRAELNDSVFVTVVASDDIAVDTVGATLLTIHRLPTRTDTLSMVRFRSVTDSATFRVSLSQLGVPFPTDTSTVRLEVTGFALDTSGNCATATLPGTSQSDPCTSRTPPLGVRSGARFEILMVRGRTILPGFAGDRLADLVADDSHLYLSNLTRNRLEVLAIGETTFMSPISVGSRPWGLAFNLDKTRLYVANSGGTNLSVVSPVLLKEVERIQTPNVKLFDITFDSKRIPDPADPLSGDSITGYFPSNVTRHDYSDRPQFIGVTQNENLIFSTLPTTAARNGTVRVYRKDQERLEIVTDYAEDRIGTKLVLANADSAFLVLSSPNNLLQVCPRNRSADPDLDRQLPETCYVGPINVIEATIRDLGYDTKFFYGMNILEIGLSDTTFVAVSGDHSSVAIGEGARANGRVVSFVDPEGSDSGPLVKFGEISDLVGNVAERVFGLDLNIDGSLGIARGSEAFFFSRDLRLQGVINTEPGAGGVAMHPENPLVDRSFVPGVQPNGLAFVDVLDSFHFRRIARVFMRDPIIGPLRAVVDQNGDLMLYGVTKNGLVVLEVDPNDL